MTDYGHAAGQQGSHSGQAPIFKGGNSVHAAEMAAKIEQYLAQQAARATDRRSSSLCDHLVVSMATCFPEGTDAALWFDAARGVSRGMYQAEGDMQPAVDTVVLIYLREWELHCLHSLEPDTPVADAVEFRDRIHAAMKSLWPEDLRRSPPNLHRLIQSAHRRYLTANPTHAMRDREQPKDAATNVHPLFTPASAALRCDYTTDVFSNDFMRLQFHPQLEGVRDRRAHIHTAIADLVATIPDDWTRTRTFFNRQSITRRLERPPTTFVKYLTACFKAQWVGVGNEEHQLLTRCFPLANETFKSWIARYTNLVNLTRSEPPLTREKLCAHFMRILLDHYGAQIHDFVKAEFTRLEPTTRNVTQLYAHASRYHRDHIEPGSSRKASTPTRPSRPAEQSPGRGRTPYPTSPARNPRLVSFNANTNDYYSPPRHHHQHRQHSPEPRDRHYHRPASPERYSSYVAAAPSTSSSYCTLCKDNHKDGICFYNSNPSHVPDWWQPLFKPHNRYAAYLSTCQANGWDPKPPSLSDPPARRPIPMPTSLSSATAHRPQSTRTVLSSTSQSRSPRGGGTRAPSYHNQPPPEQLHRQQERGVERRSSYYYDADEPEFESEFCASVLEATTTSEPPTWAEAYATTRSSVLRAQGAAAASQPPPPPRPREPAPAPEQAPSPPTSVVPEPRLRREPPPVGFTADQLPRGLLPAQLPARLNTQLAAAQLGAVQRAQALPLSSGVVPLSARMQKGGGGLVGVQLQQLVNFAGMAEFFREPLPLVIAGVGTEQYAVDMSQVVVLMGPTQAVQVFGGLGERAAAVAAGEGYAEGAGMGEGAAAVAAAGEGCAEGAGMGEGAAAVAAREGCAEGAGTGEEGTKELATAAGGQECVGGTGEQGGEPPEGGLAAEPAQCAHAVAGDGCSTTVLGTTYTFNAPSITYLEAGKPQAGVSLVCNGELLASPRTLLDSGANINGIPLRVALACGAKFSAKQRMALRGASKTPSTTLGRVTTELDVCLCLGTSAAVTLRLPLHVVDTGDNQSWDLLLGTGFLATIGAKLDYLTSTLSFRPQLINTPNADKAAIANLATHTIPITTTTNNPSAAYLRDLLCPATGGAP